jgi:transposase-like protein
MKRVTKTEGRINRQERMREIMRMDIKREARLSAIQMLIPIALEAVEKDLQGEVMLLAGERYARGEEIGRWGRNPGSVYLGDQKVKILVPRLRNQETGEEVNLAGYRRLQNPGLIEESALLRVINGISQRKYEKAVLSVPETFGISRQSVSKKWIRASGRRLRVLMNRSLKEKDIVAVVMDGKSFGENEIIVALGITITGEKIILGFIESSTENFEVCRDFMRELVERGLNPEKAMLFVLDGGKGLYKGVKFVFGEKAFIQRCQWHKRENVLRYLDEKEKPEWRRKLQAAYEEPIYEEAKKKLNSIKNELGRINQSAVRSLEEGFEETLTLHKLGLFKELGTSLKTTNCIENVNRMLGIYTDRVSRWTSSDQRQRWVGTALLEIEPRLRKIKGHKNLMQLRQAMQQVLKEKNHNQMRNAA